MDADNPRAGPDLAVEAYKAGVDRSLIRENLRRSVEQPLEALVALREFADELRRAGRRARSLAQPERLALALTPYHPYLRGAPRGLPFRWDTTP